MFRRYRPKSYYGLFSFFIKQRLYVLFLVYFLLISIFSFSFSFFYLIEYAGPITSRPSEVCYFHRLYYSVITFISPGFTEFLPKNDLSRLLSIVESIIGMTFNVLFLSILVARALMPYEPFVIVPFVLYDPIRKTITARFYSTLPTPIYNINFKLHRFFIFDNKITNKQMGRTIEISTNPNYRNMLIPNYGILVKVSVEKELNNIRASIEKLHNRKKIPIEWLLIEENLYVEGHFYLTIEAETSYGKMFQRKDFYLNKKNIKCGRHALLNENKKFTLNNWYNWKEYRWDLWGKFLPIKEETFFKEDKIWEEYK